MPDRPQIAIIFTGGTIASKLDREWGGVVPSMSGGEILVRIPEIQHMADVVVHEYGTYPGPHITPIHMLELSRIVQNYFDDPSIRGVIITHGTDTLEETAYFLDSTVASAKPVIVVGAMRNSSEPDWDGPRNLRDAVTAATSGNLHEMGVIVCLGGIMTAASETSKTNTEALSTFTSFDFGPVGRITNGIVFLHRRPQHRQVFHVENIPAFVPLLKLYSGGDATLVDICLAKGANGLVVEAFGVGNVTPPVFYALKKVVASGVPVVLVSRCPVGRVEHLYAYEGAGRHLHEAGVVFADYLNGQKARIKLICALGAGLSNPEIKQAFEWADAQQTS